MSEGYVCRSTSAWSFIDFESVLGMVSRSSVGIDFGIVIGLNFLGLSDGISSRLWGSLFGSMLARESHDCRVVFGGVFSGVLGCCWRCRGEVVKRRVATRRYSDPVGVKNYVSSNGKD